MLVEAGPGASGAITVQDDQFLEELGQQALTVRACGFHRSIVLSPLDLELSNSSPAFVLCSDPLELTYDALSYCLSEKWTLNLKTSYYASRFLT